MGNFIGITLNLQIALSSMAMLTMLIPPLQRHGISFRFLESSSTSFNQCFIVFNIEIFYLPGQVLEKEMATYSSVFA